MKNITHIKMKICCWKIVIACAALAIQCKATEYSKLDYAAYEKEAWSLYQTTNREALMPTAILNNLNRAIELAPNHVSVESYILRGSCWAKAKEDEKAFRDWAVAIDREPTDIKVVEAYCGRAVYWGMRKEYPRALEDVNRAIELAPNLAFARTVRAVTYRELGMMEEAKEEFQTAIKLDSRMTNLVNSGEFFSNPDAANQSVVEDGLQK